MRGKHIAVIFCTLGMAWQAPVLAADFWHTAPGEAGFVEHPDHLNSSTTRAEMQAREAAERDAMAAKGYRWSQLFAAYQYVGTAPAPAAKAMTREELRQREAEEFRQMEAKGYRWSQLLGAYQYVGTSR